MRFYTKPHKYYCCGIDLHARAMYACILDSDSNKLVHRNLRARPEPFLRVIEPYREDLVVDVECMFTWYWLADLCKQEGITFVLGHALYMKAIHGGKVEDGERASRITERCGMQPELKVTATCGIDHPHRFLAICPDPWLLIGRSPSLQDPTTLECFTVFGRLPR